MIIIEGSDLVGKTTLAKKLVSLGSPFGPLVYRRLGLLPGNFNFYDDYVNRMSHLVVQDRFYLSEFVYGPICRGGTPLTQDMVKRLADDLVAVGGLHVILTASEETLKERWEKNKKREIFSLDDILRVNAAFENIVGAGMDGPYCYYGTQDKFDYATNDTFLSVINSKHHSLLIEIYNKCDQLWDEGDSGERFKYT